MADLLKKSELARLLRCDPKTIDAWVLAGRLPKPVRLGPSSVRFRLSDVKVALAAMGLNIDSETV